MATRTSSTIIAGVLLACTGLVFAQSREDIDQALRDFAAGKPLPNMPDLKKPVFLAEGVIVCESPGALANPNKDILIAIRACALIERRQRVSVVPPRTQQQYLDGYVFRVVRVVWRADDVSDATAHAGWTSISNAQN